MKIFLPYYPSRVFARRFPACFFFIIWLCGCAAAPQYKELLHRPPPQLSKQVELTGVPFFPQEKYQCGPAALATVLQASGVKVTPGELVEKVYIPSRQGSLQVEMIAAARQYQRIPYQIEPSLQSLLEEVARGRPVLVLQNLGLSWYPQWHYAVVAGYDLEQARLTLRSGTHERLRTKFRVFENTWRRGEFWALVLLKPGELPVNTEEHAYFLAVAAFAKNGLPVLVEQAYLSGIAQWPDSLTLQFGLANHYYLQERWDAAQSAYRKVLQLDPQYGPAHNNLAQLLFEQQELESAVVHAQQAVALGGEFNGEYQATLKMIRDAIKERDDRGIKEPEVSPR